MPFLMIATMIEISAALFDFAIHAADRYPKRGRQSGILCFMMELGMPGNNYNWLGWIIWEAYPTFITARCVFLGSTELPEHIVMFLVYV